MKALPKEETPALFAGQIKQLNTGEVFLLPEPQFSQFRQPQAQFQQRQPFRQSPPQVQQKEQFRQSQFQQRQPFRQSPPQALQNEQFRQPQTQFQQFNQQPSFFPAAAPQKPAAVQFSHQFSRQEVYGVPEPQPTPAPLPEVEEAETEDPETESDDNAGDGPVIAIANANTNGQYYILAKDNTLQRVVYMTTQTEDDIINDGFTAQLRYAPVEPIRDPIYAYDAQGQLVKIYNKKK